MAKGPDAPNVESLLARAGREAAPNRSRYHCRANSTDFSDVTMVKCVTPSLLSGILVVVDGVIFSLLRNLSKVSQECHRSVLNILATLREHSQGTLGDIGGQEDFW